MPATGWVGGSGGGGLLLRSQPSREVLLGLDDDDDRHEAVVFAAKLRALTAVDAGLLGFEPGIANEAGNGILLDRQCRHIPGVDHVSCRGQNANLLADRHYHVVVRLEQVVRIGVAACDVGAFDLGARRGQRAL